MKTPVCSLVVGLWVVAGLAGCTPEPVGPGSGAGAQGLFGRANDSAGREANFSVLLHSESGPDAPNRIAYYKQNTEAETGWQGLYSENTASGTGLYWGRYRTIDEAQANLTKAQKYVTRTGVRPYPRAMVVPIRSAEVGPAEWRLENCPGAYTMVVAVFYDDPEVKYFGRKENAVEYCRQLRREGHQAYYHHGVARSSVTIGSMPASALVARQVSKDTELETKIRYDLVHPLADQVKAKFPYLAVNGRRERVAVLDAKPARGGMINVTKDWKFVETYPAHVPGKGEGELGHEINRSGDAKPR